MLAVTLLGIQCRQAEVEKQFGEAEKQGVINQRSSLLHCDKHLGACRPPLRTKHPQLKDLLGHRRKRLQSMQLDLVFFSISTNTT